MLRSKISARSARWFLITVVLAVTPRAFGVTDSLCTGTVISAARVKALFPNQTYVGGSSYAVVNSGCLSQLQELFVATVYRNGLKPEWSPRFACGKFSMIFVATARLLYFSRHGNEAHLPTLAVGEVWFTTGPHSAHAIVAAITERGVVYWDPQCGREVDLDEKHLAGTFLRKF